MEDNKNISYCLYTLFNDNYFEQGTNLIYSFLRNNTWFSGDIIVICDDGEYCGLSEEHREYIKKLYKDLYFLDIDHNEYTRIFNVHSEFTSKDWLSCFYKYEIFKNNKYDKKIYLDSDIIVSGDIRELFFNNINFGACLDMAFKDDSVNISDGKLIVSYRNDKKFYFNGGVYVVDKKFNEINTFEYIFNRTASLTKNELTINQKIIGHGSYVDQDCLNLIFENKDVIMLPNEIYNCNPSIKDLSKFRQSKIKHFYGWVKPWREDTVTALKDYYLEYYMYTYWKNKEFKIKM